MRRHPACALLALFPLLATVPAEASVVTVPPGLVPGAQYRLAFVTSTMRNPQSTDIADYNTFVITAANAVPELSALGTTWRAIASTPTVDARDNTDTNPTSNGTGVPIFRLDGIKIADDNADLWDGSLDATLNVDELGNPSFANVWTGTRSDGVKAPIVSGGGGPLGTGSAPARDGGPGPRIGLPNHTEYRWIFAGVVSYNSYLPLYGLSGTLVAPVPLPAALPLFASALAALAGLGRRRR